MILSDLEGKHAGETVWVLGSGPTLGFIDPGFFDGKTVVATNYSASVVGVHPDYMFSHYPRIAHELRDKSGIVVTTELDQANGAPWLWEALDNLVLIPLDSYQPPGDTWDPFTRHIPRDDSLVYGSSSLHGAMHLAAHLGANHIVLVGADCGLIDDQHRVANYPVGHTPWALYNRHHKLMKDYLAHRYGVTVYSLNPFINLNIEGHKFTGVA